MRFEKTKGFTICYLSRHQQLVLWCWWRLQSWLGLDLDLDLDLEISDELTWPPLCWLLAHLLSNTLCQAAGCHISLHELHAQASMSYTHKVRKLVLCQTGSCMSLSLALHDTPLQSHQEEGVCKHTSRSGCKRVGTRWRQHEI